MSWDNYKKAITLMAEYEDECDFVGERSEDVVKKAEQALGLRFSNMYRDFVKRYGAGNFGGEEIYGVIGEDFENSSVPDAIWVTLTERKESNLPQNVLVITDTGMGEWYCLDFNQCNAEGEPLVITYDSGLEPDEQKYDRIANNFGDFLLALVKEEVDY
ncbi:SMI1/KNR4 family protein [Bacillus sp. S13(2024)]|uniref:SMI1/KNR4 family protein n=1 Tax=unclassified Bacillus (in: firmicutes) TaxID=185979 RepID=UPI003D249DC7